MYKKLPIGFKALIWLNSLISLSSLGMLGFYIFNNVVSDNGMPVEPLKILYTIVFLSEIIMILLLLFTKKIAVTFESLCGISMIVSGIGGNAIKIIIGIIILVSIFNKKALIYTGFAKSTKKVIRHHSK